MIAVVVSPSRSTLAAGLDQQFSLKVAYNDGTAELITSGVAWTTSDPAVAGVSSTGLVHSTSTGTVKVSATDTARGRTASADLVVTPPVLESLSILSVPPTLPVGRRAQLAAQGRLTDGTVAALDNGNTWESSQGTVASTDATGRVTGLALGSTTIRLTHAGTSLAASATLTVSNAVLDAIAVLPGSALLAPWFTQPFSVSGTLSDGSTIPLGSDLTWSSSTLGVATLDSSGTATALAAGNTIVTAIHAPSGLSGTAGLTVSSANLIGLDVSPNPVSVPLGSTVSLTTAGVASDNTTGPVGGGFAWISNDPAIASVNASGNLTGLAIGSTDLLVSHGPTGLTASVPVSVGPAALVSITMSPANSSMVVHQVRAQIFTVTGHYSDGSSQDLFWPAPIVPVGLPLLNWTSGTPAVATVDDRGYVWPISPGIARISATDPVSGLSGSATVTVAADVLVGISFVFPDFLNGVRVGQTIATGPIEGKLLSGVSVFLLPAGLTWSSSNTAIATVSAGDVLGVAVGSAQVTATDPSTGASGSLPVTVVP